jgi:hypothetical protein
MLLDLTPAFGLESDALVSPAEDRPSDIGSNARRRRASGQVSEDQAASGL